MNTKLTLTIEHSVIEKAKIYARKKDRSLSALIENYLKVLIEDEPKKSNDVVLTSTVNMLKGSFKMPKNFDYKEALAGRLSEKYL